MIFRAIATAWRAPTIRCARRLTSPAVFSIRTRDPGSYARTGTLTLAHGEVPKDPALGEIGEAHGKSAGQVALRWLLDHKVVTTVPKASSHERRRENFEVFDFELSTADMASIAGLDRGGRVGAEPDTMDFGLPS